LEPQLRPRATGPALGRAAWRVQLGVCTDVGHVREQNEDRWLVFDLNRRQRMNGTSSDEQPLLPPGHLLVVADGMGGMTGGERASQICVDTLAEELTSKLGTQATTRDVLCQILMEAVGAANQRIHREAAADQKLSGMGTTLTAAVVGDGAISIVQVGDSRAYLVRGAAAQQLTRDQTIWESMLAAGQNPEQSVGSAPWKNMLVQAVGAQAKVDPVLSDHEMQAGDTLVLCSDGLHRVVKAEEIADVATREKSPTAAAQALVALANERGGPDNVTVVVGHVSAR
jgi:serine/threonine protein phosphatase PrpC